MKLMSAYAKQMTLRTQLAAPILKMSSKEDICKTRAEENHHNRIARHRASSPQVRNHSSDFTAGVDQRESSSDTPEQSRLPKSLPRPNHHSSPLSLPRKPPCGNTALPAGHLPTAMSCASNPKKHGWKQFKTTPQRRKPT
jgi:hypothetical protein